MKSSFNQYINKIFSDFSESDEWIDSENEENEEEIDYDSENEKDEWIDSEKAENEWIDSEKAEKAEKAENEEEIDYDSECFTENEYIKFFFSFFSVFDSEIDYDLEYFTENEPISTDDEIWRGDNIKKIKNSNMYFQKESRVVFEIDEYGFYIFKGLNIDGSFIDHQEKDIPEVILNWVRQCDLYIPSK
jgi:hypothetical protein